MTQTRKGMNNAAGKSSLLSMLSGSLGKAEEERDFIKRYGTTPVAYVYESKAIKMAMQVGQQVHLRRQFFDPNTLEDADNQYCTLTGKIVDLNTEHEDNADHPLWSSWIEIKWDESSLRHCENCNDWHADNDYDSPHCDIGEDAEYICRGETCVEVRDLKKHVSKTTGKTYWTIDWHDLMIKA